MNTDPLTHIDMPITNQNIERLEIGDGVHIVYDKADTWLAIGDDDWTSYDRPGGVALDAGMIDALIEKLKEVKAAIGSNNE